MNTIITPAIHCVVGAAGVACLGYIAYIFTKGVNESHTQANTINSISNTLYDLKSLTCKTNLHLSSLNDCAERMYTFIEDDKRDREKNVAQQTAYQAARSIVCQAVTCLSEHNKEQAQEIMDMWNDAYPKDTL